MREIDLDASYWRGWDDLYDALLFALQAPSWHGRNLHALSDSIMAGGINQVEAPYRIRFIGLADTSKDGRAAVMETAGILASDGLACRMLPNGDVEILVNEQEVPAPKP